MKILKFVFFSIFFVFESGCYQEDNFQRYKAANPISHEYSTQITADVYVDELYHQITYDIKNNSMFEICVFSDMVEYLSVNRTHNGEKEKRLQFFPYELRGKHNHILPNSSNKFKFNLVKLYNAELLNEYSFDYQIPIYKCSEVSEQSMYDPSIYVSTDIHDMPNSVGIRNGTVFKKIKGVARIIEK